MTWRWFRLVAWFYVRGWPVEGLYLCAAAAAWYAEELASGGIPPETGATS